MQKLNFFTDKIIYSLILKNMFIKLYVIALPVFFAIDMVWLGLVAKNFYRQQIGYLMKPDINWTAAIIFYLLFIAGLVTSRALICAFMVISAVLPTAHLNMLLIRGPLLFPMRWFPL